MVSWSGLVRLAKSSRHYWLDTSHSEGSVSTVRDSTRNPAVQDLGSHCCSSSFLVDSAANDEDDDDDGSYDDTCDSTSADSGGATTGTTTGVSGGVAGRPIFAIVGAVHVVAGIAARAGEVGTTRLALGIAVRTGLLASQVVAIAACKAIVRARAAAGRACRIADVAGVAALVVARLAGRTGCGQRRGTGSTPSVAAGLEQSGFC